MKSERLQSENQNEKSWRKNRIYIVLGNEESHGREGDLVIVMEVKGTRRNGKGELSESKKCYRYGC